MPDRFDELLEDVRSFVAERDWEQFHAPKNLACALAVEAAELLEHFQWLTEEQSRQLPPDQHEEASLEAADVFLYLIQFTDKLGIDLLAATRRKLAINATRYPASAAKGSSKKYTDL
jgi:dCTP diphosphatase